MATPVRPLCAALLTFLLATPALSDQLMPNAAGDPSNPGGSLYQEHCQHCHNGSTPKAPATAYLREMFPQAILRTLESGAMRVQGQSLDDGEKRLIAEFVTGKKFSETVDVRPRLLCDSESSWFDFSRHPLGTSWGIDAENTRFIPGKKAGISSQDVHRLKLKWAFSFPGANRARSQPAIAGGAVFLGSHSGEVYALDADSGCVHWIFAAQAEVRTAIAVTDWPGNDSRPESDGPTLVFGDQLGQVYAVNAANGNLLWKQRVDEDPDAVITGAPVIYGQKVYAPVSSLEPLAAADPNHSCCSFRGSIVALDLGSGKQHWKTYTIAGAPREQYKNSLGVPQMGPSGAPVWSSPTIDIERNRLYFGTGENYSSPADQNSDAIFALDLTTGEVIWSRQFWEGDAWNLSCGPIMGQVNCPREDGVDFDFGASPILVKAEKGSDILVAAQKSGDIYGLDPDQEGKVVWHRSLGRGGFSGGVRFGLAAAGGAVFVPIDDRDDMRVSHNYPEDKFPGAANPGLFALDAFSGEPLWSSKIHIDASCDDPSCKWGYTAAATAAADVVFASRSNGLVKAFESSSGELLWENDTRREYVSVNGNSARGGSLSGPGPVVADGKLYMNSGYGDGAVFLVFELHH